MTQGAGEPIPLADFDFALTLAPEQVAQTPVHPRDASRLLHLDRGTGDRAHHRFAELPDRLRRGDLLVVNQTRVLPARLRTHKESGGAVELLLCHPTGDEPVEVARRWRALGRPARGLRPGTTLRGPGDARLRVVAREDALVVVEGDEPLCGVLERFGEMPLPPYIQRPAPRGEDRADYQTVFARVPGSVAAPTAGLHFTDAVLDALAHAGVSHAAVTLHVGPGTFLPVRPEHAVDVRAHRMHAEWYEVPEPTLEAIERTRDRGGRVVAVGTTSLRALESWARTKMRRGQTDLFVVPGYDFAVVDGLLTNFHQPRSTLLMLVCALAGLDPIREAYREAAAEGYRFYSYGDAMLIL